jgi:glutaredoxin 3
MPEIIMYKKSHCPYCVKAAGLLQRRGVKEIREINIEGDEVLMAEMLEKSGGRRTVPQIFIGGVHIGGCDDLHKLDDEGKLMPMLGS